MILTLPVLCGLFTVAGPCVGAGPIDAYRANAAAIKVSMSFKCNYYDVYEYSRVLTDLEKFKPGPGLAEKPNYTVDGRWESDGSCEHYLMRFSGGSRYEPSGANGPVPNCEVLYDGTTFAYHFLGKNEKMIHVVPLVDEFPFPLVGALTFNVAYRLEGALAAKFKATMPVTSKGKRGEHPVEVEIYERVKNGITLRREIAFDPSINYLPRHMRTIAFGLEGGRSVASVAEVFVLDATPCTAGGFVPNQWSQIGYHVYDFATKYPAYDENTHLTPSDQPTLAHFEAENVANKVGPVKMDQLEDVNRILAPGGAIFPKNGRLQAFTLAEAVQTLGKKIDRTAPLIVATVDQEEIHEFDQPPRSGTWIVPLIGVLLIIGVLVLVRKPFKVNDLWRERITICGNI